MDRHEEHTLDRDRPPADLRCISRHGVSSPIHPTIGGRSTNHRLDNAQPAAHWERTNQPSADRSTPVGVGTPVAISFGCARREGISVLNHTYTGQDPYRNIITEMLESILDEGTRASWADPRVDDYLDGMSMPDEHDPGLRASIQALLSHSASPADSFVPAAPEASDDSSSSYSSDSEEFASDASLPPSTAPSDPVDSEDPRSGSAEGEHPKDVSHSASFSDPPTPARPADRVRALKRSRATDESVAAARKLFAEDRQMLPSFYVLQHGDQAGIFDSPPLPIDFFRDHLVDTPTSLERLLLSRLVFYTAAREGLAWSAFNTDVSVYADPDLVSWFLAPSFPLILLCATHALFLGRLAPEDALEQSARGAVLRSLLARIQLLRGLRDLYRARFSGRFAPSVRAHLLGQPCRFAQASRVDAPCGYMRLCCTAEDCAISHYRAWFLERHPSGELPNARELRAAKKSAEAFPIASNLPFCFESLERHWRRDLPCLDRDLFRDTLAASRPSGGRYPVGPGIFYLSQHSAFFATLPPSQSAHGSELLGGFRLPFTGLGRRNPRMSCGHLAADVAAHLATICEAERMSRAPLLTSSATYAACRAADITNPLVALKDRLQWLLATRRLFDRRPDLVRNAYPLPDSTFETFMQAATDAPPAKRRRSVTSSLATVVRVQESPSTSASSSPAPRVRSTTIARPRAKRPDLAPPPAVPAH